MIIIYSVVQPTLSISLCCFPALSFAGVIWGSWHMAQSIYTQFVDIAITFTFNPLHDTRANVIIHCMGYATFTCFILNQLNGVHDVSSVNPVAHTMHAHFDFVDKQHTAQPTANTSLSVIRSFVCSSLLFCWFLLSSKKFN